MSSVLWGKAPSLPSLVGQTRADVCVVGLGAAGLSAIETLSAKGLRVVGIDGIGVGGGAAGRNGGFLLAGPARFHHRLRRQASSGAKHFYEHTLEERDRVILAEPTAEASGSYRKFHDEEDAADALAQHEALSQDGFPSNYSESELFIPGDGTFDPMARCLRLAGQAAGLAKLWRGRAEHIEPERVALEGGAEVRAEAILVCVDGALERLFPDLGVSTVGLQMLATAPATDVSITGAQYYRMGFDYWQQRDDGRLAVGGGRDVGGEDEISLEPSTSVQAYLERLLREVIQSRAEITHRWAGLVGYTQNGLPVARAVDDGIFVCGGYSGTGNVLSTLCARSLAQLVMGRTTPPFLRTLDQLAARPPDSETGGA